MPEPRRAAQETRRRALADFWRPGGSQLIVATVLGLVGFAMVTQVNARTDETWSSLRRSDLVTMVEQLNAESARLGAEVSELEQTKRQLESGVDAQRVAEEQNRKRLDALQILAGTVPASGPGVRITITDPQGKVGPEVLLNAIEEMRDAGAETMAVNRTTRVVANTSVGRAGGALAVGGVPVEFPLVLEVLGDPHALEEASRFRGGLVSQVQGEGVGGSVTIEQVERLRVDALHAPQAPKWAKPA